jgi:putative hemolysin
MTRAGDSVGLFKAQRTEGLGKGQSGPDRRRHVRCHKEADVSAWLDVLIVLLLLITGGLFTATELALVSLRAGQRKAIGDSGRRGARVARLADDPSRYLAAVQIGSIVAGFFAAAYATATLADPLADHLVSWGVGSHAGAESIAVIVITLTVTVVALVVSELTPRRYAMQRARPVAVVLGPLLDRLSLLFRPLIWLLSKMTNALLRLLRADPTVFGDQITSEELRALVQSHEALGDEERRIVRDVFAAGGRKVQEAMLPRTDVDFLDASIPVAQAQTLAWMHSHTRYPVTDGSPDKIIGFVHSRDLLDPSHEQSIPIRQIVRPVTAFPTSKPLLPALTEMQSTASQFAVVVDEYGGLAGILTLEDIVEELIGDIYDEHDETNHHPVADDGATVVDGLMRIGEFTNRTGIAVPAGSYDTVGGMVVGRLGRMPTEGDSIEESGHLWTVLTIQGWRIAQLQVIPLGPDGEDHHSGTVSPPHAPTG